MLPTIDRPIIVPEVIAPPNLIQIQDMTTGALDALEDFRILACGCPAYIDCGCEEVEGRVPDVVGAKS